MADIIFTILFAAPVVLLLYTIMPNLGRLAGYVEDWHFEGDIRGKPYNGRTTYYFLFIPLWHKGFYHSTAMFD